MRSPKPLTATAILDAIRWRLREERLIVSCDATWRLSRGGKTVIRNHSTRRGIHTSISIRAPGGRLVSESPVSISEA